MRQLRHAEQVNGIGAKIGGGSRTASCRRSSESTWRKSLCAYIRHLTIQKSYAATVIRRLQSFGSASVLQTKQ